MKSLITVNELRQLMPELSLARASSYAPLLDAAMREFEIDSKRRRCAFLSQLAHESSQLTHWVENLNYSAVRLLEVFPKYFGASLAKEYARQPEKIASRVYANRMGNGPERTGDGWKFRGRCPIQATGRKMYEWLSGILNLPLVENPDLLLKPEHGFRAAAAIFALEKKCNALADKLSMRGDAAERAVFTDITKRINGGTNGLGDRLNYFRVAKQVLHGDEVQDEHVPIVEPVSENTVAQAESPAEVSPDTDVDLLGAAVKSPKAKAVGSSLAMRVGKHVVAAFTGFEAFSYAAKIGIVAVVVVLIAVAAWVLWHNRKRITPWISKLLK